MRVFTNIREFLVFHQPLLEVEFRLLCAIFVGSCPSPLEAGVQEAEIFCHMPTAVCSLFGKVPDVAVLCSISLLSPRSSELCWDSAESLEVAILLVGALGWK